jgi:hypothetical protein
MPRQTVEGVVLMAEHAALLLQPGHPGEQLLPRWSGRGVRLGPAHGQRAQAEQGDKSAFSILYHHDHGLLFIRY